MAINPASALRTENHEVVKTADFARRRAARTEPDQARKSGFVASKWSEAASGALAALSAFRIASIT